MATPAMWKIKVFPGLPDNSSLCLTDIPLESRESKLLALADSEAVTGCISRRRPSNISCSTCFYTRTLKLPHYRAFLLNLGRLLTTAEGTWVNSM